MDMMEEANESVFNDLPNGDLQPYSTASLAIISLIMGVIIAVTIVGNLFVILAYIRDPRVRANVGNLLILNLAITDFMVGVFSLTFNLSWLVRGYWSHGEIICKLWLVLDYTVCWVSMITMVLIGWDRYCLVSMGLRYKTYQTKKRIGLILIFVWTVVVILLSLLAFAWSPITGHYNVDYNQVCFMEFILIRYAPLVINLIPFGILLIFIVTLNASVYSNIYRRSKIRSKVQRTPSIKREVKRASRNLSPVTDGREESSSTCSTAYDNGEGPAACPENSSEGNRLNRDVVAPVGTQPTETIPSITKTAVDGEKDRLTTLVRHRRAAIVLSILTGCFVLFWLPYLITTVVYSICSSKYVSNTVLEVTEVLAWCNSTINPFIYAATNVQFRKNFRRFLLLDQWTCGARNRGNSVSSNRSISRLD